MDKLKLEHLAPYLPYGLKCHNMGNHDDEDTPIIQEIIGLDQDGVLVSCENEDEHFAYYDTFPLLRHLSDLTKEIEHNEDKFIPVSLMLEEFGDTETFEFYLLQLTIDHLNHKRFPYQIINLIISWHFDVFGLIEKGLAIDINTLESGVKND